jgi:pimeloyl-ACP methyl ester carboxylesterase
MIAPPVCVTSLPRSALHRKLTELGPESETGTVALTIRGVGARWGACSVPMSIWHGTEDAKVAAGHAVWLSEHVPGARLHLVEGADHISIISRIDSILDELLQLAGIRVAEPR